MFAEFDTNPYIEIAPFTLAIAREVAAIGGLLSDPGDRAIVAIARVLGMRLVTSDRAIIESGLAPVIY